MMIKAILFLFAMALQSCCLMRLNGDDCAKKWVRMHDVCWKLSQRFAKDVCTRQPPVECNAIEGYNGYYKPYMRFKSVSSGVIDSIEFKTAAPCDDFSSEIDDIGMTKPDFIVIDFTWYYLIQLTNSHPPNGKAYYVLKAVFDARGKKLLSYEFQAI